MCLESEVLIPAKTAESGTPNPLLKLVGRAHTRSPLYHSLATVPYVKLAYEP